MYNINQDNRGGKSVRITINQLIYKIGESRDGLKIEKEENVQKLFNQRTACMQSKKQLHTDFTDFDLC